MDPLSSTGPQLSNIPTQSNMKKFTNWLTETTLVPLPLRLFVLIFIIAIIIWASIAQATFENKYYDPFGTGIRHYVSRDDTGAVQSSLEERQVGSKPLKIEPLTSNPESPNFSEYYGIEANLKDGSVMIERENFENSALDLEQLEKANKGF